MNLLMNDNIFTRVYATYARREKISFLQWSYTRYINHFSTVIINNNRSTYIILCTCFLFFFLLYIALFVLFSCVHKHTCVLVSFYLTAFFFIILFVLMVFYFVILTVGYFDVVLFFSERTLSCLGSEKICKDFRKGKKLSQYI